MLVFFILLVFLILIIICSSIKIKIISFEFDNKNRINDYDILLCLSLFNKFDLIKIRRRRLEENVKPSISKRINELIDKVIKDKIPILDINKVKNNLKTNSKNLKVKLEVLDLKIEIAFEDYAILAELTALIQIGLSIILAKLVRDQKGTKLKYNVNPIFTNKNLVKISISCIISVKIVHIIYMIYKKKRSDNFVKRASNRGFNGNCDE